LHWCRATDDDWIADFTCQYSEEVNKYFNAPRGHKKIQLHKGFWGAYKAVESQLQAEIRKQVLILKVSGGSSSSSSSSGGRSGSISAYASVSAALRQHNTSHKQQHCATCNTVIMPSGEQINKHS
jgi:hypothetical protein